MSSKIFFAKINLKSRFVKLQIFLIFSSEKLLIFIGFIKYKVNRFESEKNNIHVINSKYSFKSVDLL